MNEGKETPRTQHPGRVDLVGEHPLGDILQIISVVLFIVILLVDRFFLKWSFPLKEKIAYFIHAIPAIALFMFGSWLSMRGVNIVFGKKRKEKEVIDDGMFSVIRHPVYLGAMLIYLGVILLTLSIPAFFTFLFVAGMYHWLARYEEKLLLEEIGDDYREYMECVPMWIPALWKKKK